MKRGPKSDAAPLGDRVISAEHLPEYAAPCSTGPPTKPLGLLDDFGANPASSPVDRAHGAQGSDLVCVCVDVGWVRHETSCVA